MKNLIKQLERSHEFWTIVSLSFLFFVLRLPSLFEPYWYGDEGIYETIGLALRKGRILYTQIWDNKPPLLYYTYALVHSNQFLVRSLSLFVGVATLITFFILAKKIFTNKITAGIATGVLVILFGLPSYEGNIANAENFMMLPIIIAGLFIYSLVDKSRPASGGYLNTKSLAIAGLLLGVAFLYKIVAIFDFSAFFIFLIITTFGNKFSIKIVIKYISENWQRFLIFALCFLIPFLLSAFYFLIVGGLGEYIHAVFQSTVGYVGYKNTFIIPQGLLITKILLLSFVIVFLFIKRQKFAKSTLFVLLWIGFSLFNSFFSQRPYTHYLIVLIPSFALLIGKIHASREKMPTTIIFAILAVILSFTAIHYFNHWDSKGTINYYVNFAEFVTGKKSISNYNSFFDRKTTRDTEIVNYINTHSKSTPSLFVWGNSAQLYPQTNSLPPGRFTVAYHISGIKAYEKETREALAKNYPQFIVIMDDASSYPFPMYNYNQVLRIQNASIYERIY